MNVDRRTFLAGAAVTAAALSSSHLSRAERADQTDQVDLRPIWKEIEKRHEESVQRLQTWIRQPSIAAENLSVNEGCELTMQMLRDAGFQSVTKVMCTGGGVAASAARAGPTARKVRSASRIRIAAL